MVFFKTLVAAVAVSAPLAALARERVHTPTDFQWPTTLTAQGMRTLTGMPPGDATGEAKASATEDGEGGCPAKFKVCVPGGEQEKYFGGKELGVGCEYGEKPDGIVISKDGDQWKCDLEEYAGGFDGFPSPEVNDGHEKGLDVAVTSMIGLTEKEQNCFLTAIVDMAKPVDMEFPQDEAKADNGARMENINKLSAACTELLEVTTDCEDTSAEVDTGECSGDGAPKEEAGKNDKEKVPEEEDAVPKEEEEEADSSAPKEEESEEDISGGAAEVAPEAV